MKIQIISDIHLEYLNSIPPLKPKAPYLFLPGDIGKLHIPLYKEFMDFVSKHWKHVFITLGNHELYHSKKDVDTLLEEYTEFFKRYKNITFLEQNIAYVEDYCILGLILWSTIDVNNANNIINCTKKIKQKIEIPGRTFNQFRTVPIGPELYNELNMIGKEWLVENYNPKHPKTIILSHYPIAQYSSMSAPQYRNQPQYIKNLFGNNINIKPHSSNKIVAISGHTHYSFDFTDPYNQNIRYISCQMGYPDEILDKDQNSILEKVFEI